MRKQLVIGLSVLALTAIGGVSEDELLLKQGVHHNTAHLIKTSRKQIFEPKSGASLTLDLPNRFSYQTASVFFVTGKKKLDFGNMDFTDPTINQCKNLGYTKTSCPSRYWKADKCPYNSNYFKTCCLNSYKYLKSECTLPRTISSTSCGGKYQCSCSTRTYPYTSSNCASPKVLSGSSCSLDGVTRYSQCKCPSTYSQTCTGRNQQGSGNSCNENGVLKYTSCKCKSGYTLTCSDLGPVTPSNYCLLNGVKYYNNCKTCENKCSLSSCPAGNVCEYEDCSQKYCVTGCAVGYTNWCTKPTTDCASLGYTKAISQCSTSNYVKCPYNTAVVACLD